MASIISKAIATFLRTLPRDPSVVRVMLTPKTYQGLLQPLAYAIGLVLAGRTNRLSAVGVAPGAHPKVTSNLEPASARLLGA